MNASDFAYLSSDNGMGACDSGKRRKHIPSLEYVRKLVGSIKGNDEISMRDRALISFLTLTGIRVDSAASLPIGAIDIDLRRFEQDPKFGTRTKFSHYIPSQIFPFDKGLLKEITVWYAYLRKEKLWGEDAPLFPGTQVSQSSDSLSFGVIGISEEFNKSTSPIRKILKERSREAGLEYYIPHSFRHLTWHLLESRCTTWEQLKAVSCMLGHARLMTSMTSYGSIDTDRADEVIKKIDFEIDKPVDPDEAEELLIKDFVAKLRQRNG